MFRKLLKHIPIAVIGGCLYMGVEIAWRGHTHWSMGMLGGLCFVLIGLIDEHQENTPPLLVQMIEGAVIVTVLEFIVGLIVNVSLGWNIWDYSDIPGNILGQVCPQFAVAWIALSGIAIYAENFIHWIADKLKHFWRLHKHG